MVFFNCNLEKVNCKLEKTNCNLEIRNCKLEKGNCYLEKANCKKETLNCNVYNATRTSSSTFANHTNPPAKAKVCKRAFAFSTAQSASVLRCNGMTEKLIKNAQLVTSPMYYCQKSAIFETCFTLVKLFSADSTRFTKWQQYIAEKR